MAHYRIIDTASWPRRDHFTFYRQFANPSFNLCVPIAAQRLYECAKDRRVSFFQLALFCMLNIADQHDAYDQKGKKHDDIRKYGDFPADGELFFRHWPLPFRLFTKPARPIMLVIENGGGGFR